MLSEKHIIKDPNELIPLRGFASCEQETTISITRDSPIMTIYVCDNTFLTKMKKAWLSNPTGWTCWAIHDQNGQPTGYFFEGKKKYLTLRKEKTITPETRDKKAAQMKLMHSHKSKEVQ